MDDNEGLAPMGSGPLEDDGRTYYADLSTEELRAMAIKTDDGRCNWKDFDRAMLLAFFHNRNRKGYFTIGE